jgi:hypothetical protein
MLKRSVTSYGERNMTLPFVGTVDPLALVALGFLVVVLVLSGGLFAWISAQGSKARGQR